MPTTANNTNNNNSFWTKERIGNYTIIFVLVFLAFFLVRFFTYQLFPQPIVNEPAQTKIVTVLNTASTSAQLASQIAALQTQVQQYRDENYQNAIRATKEAGDKADRTVNYTVAIATIFGILIAVIAFFVGKDVWSILRRLQGFAARAKLSAEQINEISLEATEKMSELSKTTDKIKKEQEKLLAAAKSKSADTERIVKEQQKKIDALTRHAAGTVGQIQDLSRSAYGTASLASGLAGPIGPFGPGSAGGGWGGSVLFPQMRNCIKCGTRFWFDPNTFPYAAGYNDQLCDSCNILGIK